MVVVNGRGNVKFRSMASYALKNNDGTRCGVLRKKPSVCTTRVGGVQCAKKQRRHLVGCIERGFSHQINFASLSLFLV